MALNEAHVILRDGTPALIRRLVSEDAALYPDFLSEVTRADLRLRFFASLREVSPALLDRLIHYDPGPRHGVYLYRAEKRKNAGRGSPA